LIIKKKIVILGSNSRVYRENKSVSDSIFLDFEIVELRHNQIELIPKGARVIIFAYSPKRAENERVADRLNANENKCLYILSASTLSWFSFCFAYSRIKHQQFDYLNNLSDSKNCLAIFGSFSDINKRGDIAFTDESMFSDACHTFLSDLYGPHYFFKITRRGDSSIGKSLAVCIYFFLGIIVGSALIKATSNKIYGYNDAWFYKKNHKQNSALSAFFAYFWLSWSVMVPASICFLLLHRFMF
jgi:hypothetical protein